MKNKALILFTFICFLYSAHLQAQCTTNAHSTNWTDAWLSCTKSQNPNSANTNSHWIRYDFGAMYTLSSTHIWNYNVSGQTDKGIKDVIIEYSTDGVNWIFLANTQFQQAPGTNNYTGFPNADFGGVTARYVLITALSDWGANGCVGFSEMRFDLISACRTPDNIAATVISGNTAQITWNAVTGAEKYKLWYRPVGSPSWTKRTPEVNTIFLNDLSPNTTYEYKVKTLCANDASVWSTKNTFHTLGDLCDVPTPNNASNITSNSALLTWSSKQNDIKYKVAYKKAGLSFWTFYWVNTNSKTLLDLDANTTYKFKVKTKCTSGLWTNWSDKLDFTTTSSLARITDNTNSNNANWDIQVFPNPASDEIQIDYGNMPVAAAYISNATGTVIREMLGDELVQKIGITHLPDGIYFLNCITVEGKKTVRRFVKVK